MRSVSLIRQSNESNSVLRCNQVLNPRPWTPKAETHEVSHGNDIILCHSQNKKIKNKASSIEHDQRNIKYWIKYKSLALALSTQCFFCLRNNTRLNI